MRLDASECVWSNGAAMYSHVPDFDETEPRRAPDSMSAYRGEIKRLFTSSCVGQNNDWRIAVRPDSRTGETCERHVIRYDSIYEP